MSGWSPVQRVAPVGEGEDASPTWGDYGSAVAAGAYDLNSLYHAAGRYLAEQAGELETERYHRASEQLSHIDAEDVVSGMTSEGRKRLEATLTSEEFWSHPFSSFALKATRQTPLMAAALIPAAFLSGPIATTAGIGAMGGAMGAATNLDDIFKQVDEADDETLQEVSSVYAGLRSMGYSPEEAKREYAAELRANKPLLNFAIGALTNAVGPAGQIGRVLKGGGAALSAQGKGMAARMGAGAAEGGGAEALEETVQDVTAQKAGVEGGLRPAVDPMQTLDAALEGTLMGTVFGGATGIPRGRAARSPKSSHEPSDATIATVEGVAADEAVALGTKNAETAPEPGEIAIDAPAAPDQDPAGDLGIEPATPNIAAATEGVAPGPVLEAEPDLSTDLGIQQPAPQQQTAPAALQSAVQGLAAQSELVPEIEGGVELRPVVETPAAPEIKEAVKTGKGRVLESLTDDAARNTIAQQRQLERNLKTPTEEDQAKTHKGAAELAAKAENAAKAAALFDEFVPETRDIPTQPRHRAALLDSLRAVVTAAKERGVTIPARPGRDKAANHLMWLRDAEKLVVRKKPPSYGELVQFIQREKMLRAGAAEEVRADRMVEGDIAMRKDQGDLEAPVGDVAERLASAETPEDVLVRREEEGEESPFASEEEAYAAGRERPRVTTVSALKNRAKVQKVAELAEKGATEGERRAAEAALQRVTSAGNPGDFVAGTDKAGTFKVEKRRRFAGMKPAAVDAIRRAENKAAPTEAQKKAGNYPKKHERVHGLEVSIENERGTIRSGKDADGKDWSVRMPDDYGYIRRTEGADGDQVDVYLGKDHTSERVFIVDQVDLRTGKFDEHKVLMGYKTRGAALEAYDKGFSDGRGLDRVGDVREMHIDEFKAWLAEGDTKKPAAAPKAAVHATPRLDRASGRTAAAPRREFHSKRSIPLSGSDIMFRIVDTTTLGGALDTVGVSDVAGESLLRQKLRSAVGDMPVHIVAESELTRNGEWQIDGAPAAYYDPTHDHIVVNEEALTNPLLGRVLIHEGIHALTTRELEYNPRAKELVDKVMSEVTSKVPSQFLDRYGFRDRHEFLAEAMTNRIFQRVLADVEISNQLATELGIPKWRKATLWEGLLNVIRQILRLPQDSVSALEAAVSLTERIAYEQGMLPLDGAHFMARYSQVRPIPMSELRSYADDRRLNAGTSSRRAGDWASSMWMLADRARSVGHDFGQAAHAVVEAKAKLEREKFRVLEKEGGLEIVGDLAAYKRTHGEEGFVELARLGFDASNLNVNLGPDANNEHLGKDATTGWQAKAKLAALNARYAALPEEGRKLLDRAVDFYRKTHNEMSLQTIKNILHVAGYDTPGLAERIFTDGLTDADKQQFKTDTVINALDRARELKQIKGWYFPFRRYGEHIVSGHYELTAPKGLLKPADDTVRFVDSNGSNTRAREAAQKFVEKHELRHVATKKLWVDKHDHSKVLEADDVNAIPAYDVRMQTQHTEFHETAAEARAAARSLADEGLKNITERTRRDETVRSSSLVSGDLKTLEHSLEQQARFKAMSSVEQAAIRQALLEASVRVLGSTKVQSSFIQRRNVAGMSQDLDRVTADYARSAAGYLARLRFQPQVDDAFRALDKFIDNNKYASADSVKRMDELRNELQRRFVEDPVYVPQTKGAKVVRRLLQISRLDKLAGVSFHVINAQEPWTTSLPVIGGRHGFARTGKVLAEAYNIIGARRALTVGLKDTAAALNKDTGFTDYLERFKQEIARSGMVGGDKARRLFEVLDYNRDRGIFSDEAIFEVGRYADPTKNIVLRGIDRADLMANQIGSAVEKINRTVTILTAYELEYRRTHNHEAAMAYSHKVTRDTMGDYSTWNAAPAFKHPLGQLALQFKKFAHKTYYLLGSTFRRTLEGDVEAAKQFGGLMVTHMVVAGAMGLPLEPFKVALMAANWFGITGYDWTDVEHLVRQKAADVLGIKGGEAFSHGLTRLIGVDTSTRQGLDSLLTFGAPRSDKPQDIKAFLFDTIAGAPASVILDQIKTAQSLAKGDYGKAVETFIPLKGVVDIIKATRGISADTNEAGREKLRAMGAWETAVQAIGFTPAARAENYAKKAYFMQNSQRDKEQRSKLINKWATASSGDKGKVWAEVREWNKGKPKDAQLTMSDLTKAAKRRKSDAKNYDGDLRVTKRDRHIHDSSSVYNVGR